jgi:hypothetical protein
MKALTLQQPFAGFVAAGIKTLENRKRPIAPKNLFGQRFAIHAGLAFDDLGRIALERTEPKPWPALCKAGGCVVATATLADALYVGGCSRAGLAAILEKRGLGNQLRFAFGPTIYVLADIVALSEPVFARGYQGFWTLPIDVETRVREQLERRAA